MAYGDFKDLNRQTAADNFFGKKLLTELLYACK